MPKQLNTELARAYNRWKQARSKLTPEMREELPLGARDVTPDYWDKIKAYNTAVENLAVAYHKVKGVKHNQLIVHCDHCGHWLFHHVFDVGEADDYTIQGFFCNKCRHEIQVVSEIKFATPAGEYKNVIFFREVDHA